MIRFLQTPGPIKKVVLGGLLTIILRRHGNYADSRRLGVGCDRHRNPGTRRRGECSR